jgi:hypothetical protein
MNVRGQLWSMEWDPDFVIVRDAAGTVVWQAPPQDAVQSFRMPSFSDSIKYFGIQIGSELHEFELAREDLQRMKDFLDGAIATSGPDAVRSIRKKAIRDLVIGALLTLIGAATSAMLLAKVVELKGRGPGRLTFGCLIFGVIMLSKGIYGLRQHRRVEALAAQFEAASMTADER